MLLNVTQLSCERDHRLLFDDISFAVEAGEIWQIKGPNGSGKTTLLRILCGLYEEFSGAIDWSLDQYPLYVGHKPGVKDQLTVLENLHWLCRLHDIELDQTALFDFLQKLGLRGCEHVSCGNLSEGQRKRVNLARLFLLKSPVWLLDEPFSAIDVKGIELIEQLIIEHQTCGGAVLFTSHQPMQADTAVKYLELG